MRYEDRLTAEQLELRKLNKRLNQRLVTAEKKHTAFLKGYKDITNALESSGFMTESKTGLKRFIERTGSLTSAQVKKALEVSRKVERIRTFMGKEGTAALQDFYRNFGKGSEKLERTSMYKQEEYIDEHGVKKTRSTGELTEEAKTVINDFMAIRTSSDWELVSRYYNSDEVQEMLLQGHIKGDEWLDKFYEYYEDSVGKPFDAEGFKGYIMSGGWK